jgi:hypothetical protein
MAPIPLTQKYELIRQQEEALAYEVARQVIEKPKASIWIIFMPIFFVFHAHRMQKYKKSIHAFARHFLHTKLLALDAARDEAATGRPTEFPPGGPAQSNGDDTGNAPIRVKQFHELAILQEHYQLLLKNPGETYAGMIRSAYGTGGEYRFFLNRLFAAEAEVNEAVMTAHHQENPEAQEIVARMKGVTEKLRERAFEEIFR